MALLEKLRIRHKGLEGKGRGSEKGPITVAKGPLRRSGSHPLRRDQQVTCYRLAVTAEVAEFESRGPRHSFPKIWASSIEANEGAKKGAFSRPWCAPFAAMHLNFRLIGTADRVHSLPFVRCAMKAGFHVLPPSSE
jgi:hypothetical protein